jgi:DNA polymerase III epsilon subunit-like protein
MIHLNGNMFVAIDVETTGLDAKRHDILEFAAVLLDEDIKPHKEYPPCSFIMRPEAVEAIDWEAIRVLRTYDESLDISDIDLSKQKIQKCMNEGIDQSRAAELFVEWFEGISLAPKSRLIPVWHNGTFDKDFITQWLGRATWEYIFDSRDRDTMTIGAFLNDYAMFNNEYSVPFPKLKLSLLASKLGITQHTAHNALDDAVVTAEVYRQLIQGFKFTPRIDHSATK